jgi:hypothetical protein
VEFGYKFLDVGMMMRGSTKDGRSWSDAGDSLDSSGAIESYTGKASVSGRLFGIRAHSKLCGCRVIECDSYETFVAAKSLCDISTCASNIFAVCTGLRKVSTVISIW